MRIELSRERLRVKVAQRRGRNEGQGLVEHALILGLIAVLAASVIVLISEHSSRKLAGVRAPMTSQ
jgi:Flp pilus assembly pilin Flp